MTCGAERRLHGPQRPSTLGWLLYFAQRPVGRIASMPVTGQLLPFGVAAQISRERSLTTVRGEGLLFSRPEGRSNSSRH